MAGLAPGVVDIGRRNPPRGVGIRLGVVRPPLGVVLPPLLGVGRRLRDPIVKLFVGSLYILGEEDEMFRLKPLAPLGGRDAAGSNFREVGVLVLCRGDACCCSRESENTVN